jgi:hypothetical protein
MPRTRLIAAVLATGALVLTGCASQHSAAVSAPVSSARAPSSSTPGSPSPSPSPTARLTISQARRTYTALVDPSNRMVDATNNDAQDAAPMAQFRRDTRAYIASLKVLNRKLAEVRWPARVQPYITAMRSTDLAADIKCSQAELRASSYGQANLISSANTWCTASQTTTNANEIRSLLHLPPVTN